MADSRHSAMPLSTLLVLAAAVAAAAALAAPQPAPARAGNSSAPPTRHLPLLSMQPAFCQKHFGTNYVWLAQSQLPCLGMSPKGCGGGKCGTLSINGINMSVNNYNSNNHDVCGTCEGCAVVFIGFPGTIPASAHAVEGQDAALVFFPPPGAAEPSPLPDCPALPPAWKTLPNKQISPGCSPSESQGSLGVAATAAECLSRAQANGNVNYAVWRGDTDKSCDVCAFRWRGSATGWKYSELQGASCFAWYLQLPAPQPSAPCPACPPNEAAAAAAPVSLGLSLGQSLSNGLIEATFGSRGLLSLAIASLGGEPGSFNVSVGNDAFSLGLDGENCTCSSSLAAPTVTRPSEQAVSYVFASPSQQLSINVTYTLSLGAMFVSKSIALSDSVFASGSATTDGSAGPSRVRMVNAVSAMEGAALTGRNQQPPSSTITKSNVQFFRWPVSAEATAPSSNRTAGAFLTAQNQFVEGPSLQWTMDQNWTTGGGPRTLDAAIIGLYYVRARASQLELAEAAAVSRAVAHFLVAPAAEHSTVKINVAWCENDYQLDISLARDRDSYKRIIDRASEMGLTHILFAPQNSDLSSRMNNTDPWGWEQLLWFGYGQKIRMGEWKPGDPLADSLNEMLDYFKLRGVKPVAYVYPILAFLAHTLPGGGSPDWITEGTYMSSKSSLHSHLEPLVLDTAAGSEGGVLRSNLANEDFIKWLPETMLAFAQQTGAGGFSFDLTYWEEGLPVASEYAQWAGWRDILAQLHTKPGCGGQRCLVDNRQANHGWGAWMWAQGGTYAEPLMSDEQPASWSFYEADLHTDRLAGNKQREVAALYRTEFCPNEVLPGFAFHQTDRDPTTLQKASCPQGRCANHSRVRDFDLLGYRYSLLSSIGSGGLNNVLNMLPARDTEEYTKFPKADLGFVREWLAWTDKRVQLLKLTRPIPSLATPGAGLVDGTIMLRANDTGTMFLFNPTMREINISLQLSGDGDTSLGFACGSSGATASVLVRQVGSSERSALGSQEFNLGLLECSSGVLSLTLPPTCAKVVEFDKWEYNASSPPLVLATAYSQAAIDKDGVLSVNGAQGESGTDLQLSIILPPGLGTTKVSSLTINGQKIKSFSMSTSVLGSPQVIVHGGAAWRGRRFKRAQEILPSAPFPGRVAHADSSWVGTFIVPQAAMDQLVARNASYDLVYNTNPDDSDDANVPWLAPGRLLIFIKYMPPIDDSLNLTGSIDGKELLVRKAYNTIVRNPGRFIGHWADVTHLVQPGTQQKLQLQLPGQSRHLIASTLQGIFFENVETIFTNELASLQ